MYIFQFNEGLARVKKDGYKKKKRKKGEKKEYAEWLFLNKNFESALNLMCNWVGDFKAGLARVNYDDYIAFIDKTGNEVMKIENKNIEWIDDFEEDLARVQFKDGTMGYINKSGKIVFQTQQEQTEIT
jgi:hypothetical protein